MARLTLSFACWDYDRTRALQDGRVRPEGIDLTCLVLPVEETFYRQLRHHEFDISEMSLSSYLLTLSKPAPPFVALPVFPSRSFRHQSIYVNTANGVSAPGDLVGRRVGTPEFQLTAGVWQRGILGDDFGVPPESVQYYTGAVEQSRRTEKLPLDLPERFQVTPIGDEQNLSDMLAAGELDAVYSAGEPSCLRTSSNVRRLFENFQQVEEAYFARTCIFPIMHVVVVKRELHEHHPWIARSLYKAFEESLAIARADLLHRNALKVMLPWLQDHLDQTVAALGDDYWSYGLEPNRHVLETFARYSYEQGLADRQWTPEDIVLHQAGDEFRL